MAMGYVVLLGAPAPLPKLQRAVRSTEDDLDGLPLADPTLGATFPAQDVVVAIVLGRRPAASQAPPITADALISRRHTITRPLRRLVARAVRQFGSVRLLVHETKEDLPIDRRQTATLAGFMRVGRVAQEEVVLTIVSS